MDISSASSVSALSGQAVGDAMGTSIQKKAAEMDKQNVAAPLNSVQQPAKISSSNLPPNLGRNVNTTAELRPIVSFVMLSDFTQQLFNHPICLC